MANDATWVETTDGGLLKQLFGYFPTLHDAVIRSFEIDRGANRVTMDVYYRDAVGEAGAGDLAVTFRLEWTGVRSFDAPLGEVNLYGLDFVRKGRDLVTNLEVYPGVFATIVSESVEATLTQVDARLDDELAWIRVR